jgi:hypothetical protein
MIDRATVNLYSCCKCNHRWLADWDNDDNRERPVPVPTYCPKCKNVRWNQKYTKEEDLLFDRIFEQHTVKRVSEPGKYQRLIAQRTGRKISDVVVYLDPIAYLFLYNTVPQPDMFELRQVLNIPNSDIEKRHEVMISIIEDRVNNAVGYEKRFSKLKGYWFNERKRDLPVRSEDLFSIKPFQVDEKHCEHATKDRLLSEQLEALRNRRINERQEKDQIEYNRRLEEKKEELKRKQMEQWKEEHRKAKEMINQEEMREKAQQLDTIEIE